MCPEAAAEAAALAERTAAQQTWVGLVSDALQALSAFDDDLSLDQLTLEVAFKVAAARSVYLSQV